MTIFEQDNFRLCTITKIVGIDPIEYKELSIKEGISIEKKVDDAYIVISSLTYDKRNCCARMYEDTSLNILTLSQEEFLVYKSLLKSAKEILENINEVE